MWLCRAEKYFSLHEIAESDKVSLVSFYLEGDGQLWFQMLEQEQLYVTWEDFKNGLQTRFGPNQFVDPFDKKVSCFVTGLKDSIRTDVQANLLSTLTIAIGLARLYEARDTTQRGPAGTTSSRVNNTWRQGMGYPGRTSTNTTTQIKKMTADELSERQVGKMKRVMCWEVEGDNEEIEPEISLHAIAGLQAPKTMKILGEKLVSPGKCSSVPFKLQKVTFMADFFILPLEGYDVVLGTQWLRTLGPIQWDFEKLQMAFKWQNKEVVLRGLTYMSNNNSDTPLNKITKQQPGVILHVLNCEDVKVPQSIPASIQQILQQYHDVLKKPTSLPP
ncbi:hypothetical protein JRO89_XS15G0078500 [Xanthoceras sorbifolium]|uniref:Retrotransposon gag domain-containing protein n=1 Tax=Xanthoceras sorbifolium TaxID=99658 RepID=A0ABQ8H199_9ROSI|nr:hypothetical protein JRO89_XS15G0078500 [Xanthoceras sorbifolium]